LELCRSLLNQAELARAAKFFKPQDAEKFILCRGLLRRILGGILESDPASLAFELNEYGKPYLDGTELEFNVSHSHDRLLIATGFNRAIGVDIEFRRGGINMDAIASRWYAPAERAFFQGSENPERAFFEIWARKEAYVKALGQGIFQELNALEVPLDNEPGVPRVGKNNEWFFQSLEIDPSYAAALVSETPITPIKLPKLF
jgi:4'-phosphopantetheinyl transferase